MILLLLPLLQGAGLRAERKRGVHRRWRERRPLPGMLLPGMLLHVWPEDFVAEAGSPEYVAKTMTDQRREIEKSGGPHVEEEQPPIVAKKIFRYRGQLVTAYLTKPEPREIEGATIVNVAGDPDAAYTRPDEDKILSEKGEWLASRNVDFVIIPFAAPEEPPRVDSRPIPTLPEPAAEFAPTAFERIERQEALARRNSPPMKIFVGRDSNGRAIYVNHLMDSI